MNAPSDRNPSIVPAAKDVATNAKPIGYAVTSPADRKRRPDVVSVIIFCIGGMTAGLVVGFLLAVPVKWIVLTIADPAALHERDFYGYIAQYAMVLFCVLVGLFVGLALSKRRKK
jgi:hypothetical protein